MLVGIAGTVELATAAPRPALKNVPVCSVSRTNETCRLLIHRDNPINPPTLQMYSGARVIVVVVDPLFTERYSLDYGSTQAVVKPDVGSTLAQSLFAPVQKLQVSIHQQTGLLQQFGDWAIDVITPTGHIASQADAPVDAPAACKKLFEAQDKIGDVLEDTHACLEALSASALDNYKLLGPVVSPDEIRHRATPALYGTSPDELRAIANRLHAFVQQETAVSGRVADIAKQFSPKDTTSTDVATLAFLAVSTKLADAVAADLLGYEQRLDDLVGTSDNIEPAHLPPTEDCSDLGADHSLTGQCIVLVSRPTTDAETDEATTRTVSYSLNALNLAANSQQSIDPTKKRLVATIALNAGADAGHWWNVGDLTRWDGSAGLMFSFLPMRSFSVSPVFMNAVVTDKVVAETDISPTPIPFVGINYRLTNDLHCATWKENLYVTLAAGINPGTTSADFGAGLSFSYRSLMFSALAHFAHDTELSQGLNVGDSLGSGFSGSLTTRSFWTTSFAVAISVRVASLTGR